MSCKEVARLVSEMKDHDLSWRQRFGMRLHLMMCRMCRIYQSQLDMLSRIARQAGDFSRGAADAALPETAKQRIKDRLTRLE
jgi:hypothetical protein